MKSIVKTSKVARTVKNENSKNLKSQKTQAQCCAKTSSISVGCHD